MSSSNLSLNAIAAALRASKTSVSDVLRDAAHAELAGSVAKDGVRAPMAPVSKIWNQLIS